MLVPVSSAAQVISVPEVRAHLGIEDEDTAEDRKIAAILAGVLEDLGGQRGALRASLGLRTWDWTLDGWDWREAGDGRGHFALATGRLRLPKPPLHSVTSVSYRDPAGAPHTLSDSAYELFGVGDPMLGGIALTSGAAWPAVYEGPGAVTIRFDAGYERLPADLKEAILDRVGRHFQNRGELIDSRYREDEAADARLARYQVWA